MAVANITVFPASVTFNGATYDSTNGGPVEASYSYGGRELSDYSGDAMYPTLTVPVDAYCRASVTLRAFKTILAPGTTGTLVINVNSKTGGALTTVTMSSMCFINAEPATQPRAAPGSITLHWAHQSADGTSAPAS